MSERMRLLVIDNCNGRVFADDCCYEINDNPNDKAVLVCEVEIHVL